MKAPAFGGASHTSSECPEGGGEGECLGSPGGRRGGRSEGGVLGGSGPTQRLCLMNRQSIGWYDAHLQKYWFTAHRQILLARSGTRICRRKKSAYLYLAASRSSTGKSPQEGISYPTSSAPLPELASPLYEKKANQGTVFPHSFTNLAKRSC